MMTDQERRAKAAEYQRRYRAANKEKAAICVSRSREKNIDAARAYRKAYYEANKERIKARSAKRYEEKRQEVLRYQAAYAAANPERTYRAKRASREKRLDHYRAVESAWHAVNYAANRDEILAKSRAHHYENRERRLVQKRAWALRFPEKGAAYTAHRRAALLRARPSWADSFLIEEAYRLARLRTQMTGFRWEVDHEVPLINTRVCGLHVIENLRVIPMVLNRAKGNRYTEQSHQ